MLSETLYVIDDPHYSFFDIVLAFSCSEQILSIHIKQSTKLVRNFAKTGPPNKTHRLFWKFELCFIKRLVEWIYIFVWYCEVRFENLDYFSLNDLPSTFILFFHLVCKQKKHSWTHFFGTLRCEQCIVLSQTRLKTQLVLFILETQQSFTNKTNKRTS